MEVPPNFPTACPATTCAKQPDRFPSKNRKGKRPTGSSFYPLLLIFHATADLGCWIAPQLPRSQFRALPSRFQDFPNGSATEIAKPLPHFNLRRFPKRLPSKNSE